MFLGDEMLIQEAKWIGREISRIGSPNITPILDVGSSTKEYREKFQPWIDKYIFKQLREKKLEVKHLDIKDSPGVDIVGDLTDLRFLEELTRYKLQFSQIGRHSTTK